MTEVADVPADRGIREHEEIYTVAGGGFDDPDGFGDAAFHVSSEMRCESAQSDRGHVIALYSASARSCGSQTRHGGADRHGDLAVGPAQPHAG